MADDAEATDEKGGEEKSGGLLGKLVPAVGIFVLVLVAQVVAPPITTAVYGPPSCGPMADAEEGGEGEDGEEEEVIAADLPPALYQPLDPPMVINFELEDGSTRFLQLSLQAMTREQATIDNLKAHLPAIRNNFLFLIANREYKSLATVTGKEQLRAELLAEAKAVMKKNTGKEGVEDIYFTSFVMQ